MNRSWTQTIAERWRALFAVVVGQSWLWLSLYYGLFLLLGTVLWQSEAPTTPTVQPAASAAPTATPLAVEGGSISGRLTAAEHIYRLKGRSMYYGDHQRLTILAPELDFSSQTAHGTLHARQLDLNPTHHQLLLTGAVKMRLTQPQESEMQELLPLQWHADSMYLDIVHMRLLSEQGCRSEMGVNYLIEGDHCLMDFERDQMTIQGHVHSQL